jgi:hypothetical protein
MLGGAVAAAQPTTAETRLQLEQPPQPLRLWGRCPRPSPPRGLAAAKARMAGAAAATQAAAAAAALTAAAAAAAAQQQGPARVCRPRRTTSPACTLCDAAPMQSWCGQPHPTLSTGTCDMTPIRASLSWDNWAQNQQLGPRALIRSLISNSMLSMRCDFALSSAIPRLPCIRKMGLGAGFISNTEFPAFCSCHS